MLPMKRALTSVRHLLRQLRSKPNGLWLAAGWVLGMACMLAILTGAAFIYCVLPRHQDIAPLTLERVKNMQYDVFNGSWPVILSDGRYGPDEDRISARFHQAAFGPIQPPTHANNHTETDAAVILSYNGGGSGQFYLLAVVIPQQNGPVSVATVELGDRVLVNSVQIQNRVIILDLVIHATNEPACCPTQKATWKYVLAFNRLEKIDP